MAWCGTKKAQWLLKLKDSDILVFDLETTGVGVNTAEILQIAITDGSGSMLFSSYVRPQSRQWKMAERINGITPEMVKDAPRFSEIRKEVQGLFNRAKLIAGYNSKAFDIRLIERYGIVVPQKRFDVMEEFRIYTGRASHYKLSHCAEYFHLSFKPHDAGEDARTTARCMQQLIQQPGFVNISPPSQRKKQESNCEVPVKASKGLSVRSRVLKPFLKKRRFHPVLTGAFLMAFSYCAILYLTYGQRVFRGRIPIESTAITKTILASLRNMIIGALLPVGLFIFLFGVLFSLFKTIRWVINFIQKLMNR